MALFLKVISTMQASILLCFHFCWRPMCCLTCLLLCLSEVLLNAVNTIRKHRKDLLAYLLYGKQATGRVNGFCKPSGNCWISCVIRTGATCTPPCSLYWGTGLSHWLTYEIIWHKLLYLWSLCISLNTPSPVIEPPIWLMGCVSKATKSGTSYLLWGL